MLNQMQQKVQLLEDKVQMRDQEIQRLQVTSSGSNGLMNMKIGGKLEEEKMQSQSR